MPTTYLFVDEAGRSRLKGGYVAEQPYFIVGVLMTNDPDALLEAVGRARNHHHYGDELHWSKQSNLRVRVYESVADEILKVNDWEYKATCIRAEGFDLSHYGGREDLAYNRMVRHGIDAALRFPRIAIHKKLDISIDNKERLEADNCLAYLQEHYEGPFLEDESGEEVLVWRPVEVREVDSKDHDLIQVCDLISGAKHSMLAKRCSPRKATLAPKLWRGSQTRSWESKLVK